MNKTVAERCYKSADARYQARMKQIKMNLEIVKKLLKEDANEQKKDKDNWGYVGSLGEAASNLETMILHLGGNPIKIMESCNALLHPVKNRGDTQYVTIPD